VTLAVLGELSREGSIGSKIVQQAIKDLEINPEKPNPVTT
jgi:pyruvate dehydrogenase complex dehydrogenase (E1) component